MNESEFIRASTAMLEHIASVIDVAAPDFDCTFKGDGVLEIERDDGGKVVVNRQMAAREIWVAAQTGGHHFREKGGGWFDTRDGTELLQKLSELLGVTLGD